MVKKNDFNDAVDALRNVFEQNGILDHYRNEADPEARRTFLGLNKEEGEKDDGGSDSKD